MVTAKDRIAIVIPTYNEEENIGVLLKQLFQVVPGVRVVVIDDNSADRTAEVVNQHKNEYSRLELIVRDNEKGRGGACISGFSYILKKYSDIFFIFEMDSDLSHDPKKIPELLKVADNNTVVIGSRYVSGSKIVDWPFWRLILSRFANWYIRLLLSLPIKDCTMGFRCYPRQALEALDLTKIRNKGFITLSEIAYKLRQKKFHFKEVPVTLIDRTKGKSNASFWEVLISFVAILELKFKTDKN